MGEKSTGIKDILEGLGKLIAIVMVVRYAVLILNRYLGFIGDNQTVLTIINYIGVYAPLALMTVVGLAAVWDKSDLLKLIIAVVCAAVIIITFFPGVAESITTWLNVDSIDTNALSS